MSAIWVSFKRWLWSATKFVLVLSAVASAIYWLKLAPVRVAAHRVERGDLLAKVMGTGTLEARVKATIGPKISGRVREVLVDQGDRVAAGQPLVRLDDEELQQQVEIAQAGLAASHAAVDRLVADKACAAAVEKQARQEFARVEQMAKTEAATETELDKAVENLHVAEAGLARADAAIVEAKKQLAAAENTLKYHRARLADTEIVAPFDGLIVIRQRDHGDVVVAGSSVLTLVSTEELWISAWVDETEMASLKAGQSAQVVFRSEPQHPHPGAVARLGREVDRETREFVVDVRVLELPQNWAVGQRAEVYIETAHKGSVTLLPAHYVEWREGTPGVWANVNSRASWRRLKLGLRGRDVVEVVEGLVPGDLVVSATDRKASLHDGRRILLP